jgi:hypothetical protein
MIEVSRFKESFYQGRLMWFKGPLGVGKIRVLYEALRLCEVTDDQVLVLDSEQFIELLFRGIPRGFLSNYRALVIRRVDTIHIDRWHRFLKCLEIYNQLRFGLGVRIILTSSEEISVQKNAQILFYQPSIFHIVGEGDDPSDLNERVHGLIERASFLTEKRILRVTERVAAFLETIATELTDEEVLELLVWGIFRSKGAILRFSDLLPQNRLNDSAANDVLTICSYL